jgi:hypothetical protein
VQTALVCGEEAESVRIELVKRREGLEEMLRERFERAKTEGDIPPTTDAADLAKYVTAVSNGIAVQASGGADRESLHRVAELALNAWPK